MHPAFGLSSCWSSGGLESTMTELRMQRQSIIGKVHVLPKKIYNERNTKSIMLCVLHTSIYFSFALIPNYAFPLRIAAPPYVLCYSGGKQVQNARILERFVGTRACGIHQVGTTDLAVPTTDIRGTWINLCASVSGLIISILVSYGKIR
ncbi:hypothetical protein EV424DRAFT_185267 [Suillus variegatus]|nr:hypothetical protein EV424DRAFT_185267 [Suillus variegatus]